MSELISIAMFVGALALLIWTKHEIRAMERERPELIREALEKLERGDDTLDAPSTRAERKARRNVMEN